MEIKPIHLAVAIVAGLLLVGGVANAAPSAPPPPANNPADLAGVFERYLKATTDGAMKFMSDEKNMDQLTTLAGKGGELVASFLENI